MAINFNNLLQRKTCLTIRGGSIKLQGVLMPRFGKNRSRKFTSKHVSPYRRTVTSCSYM